MANESETLEEKIEEEIDFETFEIASDNQQTQYEQLKQELSKKLKQEFQQSHNESSFSKAIDLYYGGVQISFLKIKIQNNSIQMVGTLTQQNGLKIKVRSKIMRLSVMKYCLRLNSSFRYGAFCLGKENELQFKLNFRVLDKDLLVLKQDNLWKEFLKASIITQQSTLRFHVHRLLYLSNYLDIQNFKILEERVELYRKLPNNFEQTLLELRQIVDQSNKKDMNLFQRKKSHFTYPKQPKYQKVLTKIVIDDASDFSTAQQINEGGFAIIKKQEITFNFEGEQNKIRKLMVIKEIKDQDPQKLRHEIAILKHLNQQSTNAEGIKFEGVCTHIAPFYYSDQPKYKDYLFSDLMFHQSLDSFKAKKNDQISIQSRIYIMYGVALALYYLHQYGVSHLDLKPANILISKSLIPKLIDFGEAQCSKVHSNQVPGRTIPFAAPEMFKATSSNQTFPPSYDVYSFGVMFYEILMDRFPLEFRKSDSNNLEQRYKNGKIVYKLNEQAFLERGPKDFMQLWLDLIKKCLNEDPKERPLIQNIVIVIRESLQAIDLLY